MKTLSTLIVFIFIASFGYSQSLPLNFESTTTNYAFTDFDGGAVTIIDNTQSSGINTSAKVAKMVKNTGEHWAGSLIALESAIDFSVGKIFKMKVFSPKLGAKVLLKVENGSDPTINFEKEVVTTLSNQWEELEFDYSLINTSQSYRKIVIIFELGTVGDGSADFTYLFDDIVLVEGSSVVEDAPTTLATTPPAYATEKVISIFSDAYTDVDGTNFNPYWQQSTVGTIEDLLSEKVLKLKNLNYQGVELFVDVNAAAMKYLHVDVWTANETSLDIYPISRSTGEKKASLTPLVLNEWNSFDIRISDLMTQGFNLADLYQIKFIGAGGHTVFIDNIYFYDDTADDTELPQNFTASVNTVTYNSIELLLNATDNSGAINYSITVGGITTKIGAASGIQKSYEFTRLPSSTEFTFSISAEDTYGNAAANNSIQLVATTDQAFLSPAVSAPTPPARNSLDVISVFSNEYSNIANTNFNPYWQQSTWYSSLFIDGDEIVKYENFNYQGIEIGSQVDASQMTFLHIDLWTPNETTLSVSPISASTGEKAFFLSPIHLNEWNSYDIPLTSFSIQGLSLADLLHLKLVGSGKSIVYVDNIYFYKGSPTAVTDIVSQREIKCYPNPAKDNVTIECTENIISIEIINLAGITVDKISVDNSSAYVNISSLQAGQYFLKLHLESGEYMIQKLMKL